MSVNVYTQNYFSLVCWPLPRFLLLALGTQAYTGLSPVTTDNPSCFDASQLSMNTSTTDFSKYTFSEAAVLSESYSSTSMSEGLLIVRDSIWSELYYTNVHALVLCVHKMRFIDTDAHCMLEGKNLCVMFHLLLVEAIPYSLGTPLQVLWSFCNVIYFFDVFTYTLSVTHLK